MNRASLNRRRLTVIRLTHGDCTERECKAESKWDKPQCRDSRFILELADEIVEMAARLSKFEKDGK